MHPATDPQRRRVLPGDGAQRRLAVVKNQSPGSMRRVSAGHGRAHFRSAPRDLDGSRSMNGAHQESRCHHRKASLRTGGAGDVLGRRCVLDDEHTMRDGLMGDRRDAGVVLGAVLGEHGRTLQGLSEKPLKQCADRVDACVWVICRSLAGSSTGVERCLCRSRLRTPAHGCRNTSLQWIRDPAAGAHDSERS